jgi:hypothetical protein
MRGDSMRGLSLRPAAEPLGLPKLRQPPLSVPSALRPVVASPPIRVRPWFSSFRVPIDGSPNRPQSLPPCRLSTPRAGSSARRQPRLSVPRKSSAGLDRLPAAPRPLFTVPRPASPVIRGSIDARPSANPRVATRSSALLCWSNGTRSTRAAVPSREKNRSLPPRVSAPR